MLPDIERSAAAAFVADPELAWLADQDPIAVTRHLELLDRGLCLVLANGQDRPQGFIVAERFDDALHIWELSVVRERQGRGLGRALLGNLEQAARAERAPNLTLTTFRDLPWNGPFYARCGFQEVSPDRAGGRLSGVLADDLRHGLPAARRCAMIKQLTASA